MYDVRDVMYILYEKSVLRPWERYYRSLCVARVGIGTMMHIPMARETRAVASTAFAEYIYTVDVHTKYYIPVQVHTFP